MKPKISFFSTSYKQKKFLHNYFQNLLSLEDWKSCELVMVRPKTNDQEENAIYDQYSGIKNFNIITVDHDAGLYGSWNQAIKLCKADIVTNANTDDRRIIDCIPKAMKGWGKGCDLLYADYMVSSKEETIDYPFLCERRSLLPEFTVGGLIKYCLPGSAPFWNRKYFGKLQFRNDLMSAGDLHFWLSMYQSGAKFRKLNELCSVYYWNPEGQSTDPSKMHKKGHIERQIKEQFSQVLFYSGERFGKLEEIWVPS